MHEIKLGDVTVTRVEEMHGPIMAPGAFFPELPADAWPEHRDLLVPDHLGAGDDLVHAAMQTWLLRSEGRTILVDTGVGNDKTRPSVPMWDHLDRDFLDRLATAGVRPEDVDLVVNTHLHADHVGWNTRLVDGRWVPTFPNATYLMPRADYQPRTAGDAFEDSVVPVHESGQARFFQDTYVIDANLRLAAAPGHTPGSAVIKLSSGDDRALFAGDLLHTPLQLLYPEHNSCFCEDPAAARVSRRRLLGWAADAGALVLPAHISGHSAFEVSHRGDAFAVKQWAPFPRY
ncbi:MBL fold metallo-hydrolase [Actinoplanes sp. NPDC048967]|uniref:MBL fold metallo-hydrolase n=1 Tax=Actinoplanes sp. NPDC048967 TaxID=3155269 RepID=UPI0033E2AA78